MNVNMNVKSVRKQIPSAKYQVCSRTTCTYGVNGRFHTSASVYEARIPGNILQATPLSSRKQKDSRSTIVKAAGDPTETQETAVKGISVAAPIAALALSSALISSHALVEPLTSYFQAVGIPVIQALNPPEWVIHWFHAINMGTVLFAMGGYGSYLGWKIRFGDGDDEAFGGDTVKDLHNKLMLGMLFFFFLGGQGGLVFTLIEQRPFLESPHAISAFAGIGLLAAQAALGYTMKDSAMARTAHAYLGSSTMLLFFVHAGLGLSNGLSF